MSFSKLAFLPLGSAVAFLASCHGFVVESPDEERRDWHENRADVLERYGELPEEKAMAVAIEPDGYYTWAHGNGYRTTDGAIERAMDSCEGFRAEREIRAPCEIYMINDERQH